MTIRQGADELRIRGLLRKRGIGPDAELPELPPAPALLPAGYEPRARDWLDDILDSNAGPASAAVRTAPAPKRAPVEELADDDEEDDDVEEAPAPRGPVLRRSLAEAAPNVDPRIRWLLLHTVAAAAGWPLGLVDWGKSTAAWFAADHWTSLTAWILYGLALPVLALYRRTRAAPLLGALLGAVPVSSICLGVLLYGTA
ncbi:MAG: hypothetical protein LBV60_25820 [Streptomyces sp.]|jgi:hypothetical protein|nr:hypothetical protein [Streptomyces sp.]